MKDTHKFSCLKVEDTMDNVPKMALNTRTCMSHVLEGLTRSYSFSEINEKTLVANGVKTAISYLLYQQIALFNCPC